MNIQNKNLKKAVRLLERTANPKRKWRQKFHLTPVTGWMNDPNGLCQFQGEYHIFYQYSPFDTRPGMNFWGHYTTKDFMHYTYHEPALCCDQNFDCHGVYSGSALIHDGKMYLYYTGNVKRLGAGFDYTKKGREHNTVLAVSKDGKTFDNKILLMKNSDYPSDLTCHVRDPKVWEKNGKFYMLLGARRLDDTGEVLLYISQNGLEWHLQNRLTTEKKLGYMWECPDYIELGGKQYLMFSPQGLDPDGMRFWNVYQSGYVSVAGDICTDYSFSEFEEIDHGFDFYAPQTFEDEQGRRILIGWFGLPDLEKYYQNPTDQYGWVHCLTMPRELYERDGRICQRPLKEYEMLREAEINASKADIFEALITGIDAESFIIRVKNDCRIIYQDGVITLQFGNSGYGRDMRSAAAERIRDIRIFCDVSSLEIFVNDGEIVFSSRFYPEKEEAGIDIGTLRAKMTVWRLGGFEIEYDGQGRKE